ncbi:MAG: cbb3-type cytochrome c oxidase subunit II [Luteolibacter sp.]
MSSRTFILSLSASFGIAWLVIIIVPYLKMRSLEPLDMGEDAMGTNVVYIPKRAGRITDGAQVYAENGCYLCHTQLIRPTYAGNDMFRSDWAGLKDDEDRGDTRRETNAYDFDGEKFAQIGIARLGPDLSNLGRRVEAIYAKKDGISAEQWLYRHLYDPRYKADRRHSTCPSFAFMFKESRTKGVPSDDALPFRGEDGGELIPGSDARALVSYLYSLKKDQPVPDSLNFARDKSEEAAAPAPAAAAPEEGEAESETDAEAPAEEPQPAP